ncbi:MAG: flagellar basal body-associated FliL family protein [Candidatus Desulfofervidaceae bacterium]|nr:flagellar basal body-associated FliL family protein [Candidatus Desulfofervidaceae bacterium]
MAEEEKEEQQVETPKKRDLFKLITFGFQILTLVLVVGMFVYLKFFFTVSVPQAPSGAVSEETKVSVDKESSEEVAVNVTYHLEPFVVNLLDEGGRRYLKVSIDLILSSKKASKEMDERLPEVRDQIILCLSNKSFKEICDQTGKMHLREEIKRKLNELLASGQVIKVLFTEFVVQ